MKLTPWFSGTVNPVRPGVYERQIFRDSLFRYYAYWNGRYWGIASTSREDAKQLASLVSAQVRPWRGILKGKS